MRPESVRPPIGRVEVVMPAHDEERHIEHALHALQAAAQALAERRPAAAVGITVVLDHCTDGSADIAARIAAADQRFRVIHQTFRNAGASRAAGVAAALGRTRRGLENPGPESPCLESTWLASTDADSRVPENWLWRQLELADAGWDVVLGSVEPDPRGMDPEVLRTWRVRHPADERHPHVYGANLGVRASAYRLAGGFPEIPSSEDRVLVGRLRRRGFAVLATDTTRVVTSGRTSARAPHGFGAYLRTLGAEAPAESVAVAPG
ncbi:glycosyltransferase family 2 protein [Arthrobacter sp. ISL-5]|uniref:glycosyltransferase n=1 Tax=Arthrobacter sp. ISL-5 TaxID=2819111 RepID=UPI001BEB0D04|nr:glycosyltransferase [Arthrobacter sp. ISL-5]MBT2553132.1 glycosyltransferase [Arthrobacter sp. ISL-5]